MFSLIIMTALVVCGYTLGVVRTNAAWRAREHRRRVLREASRSWLDVMAPEPVAGESLPQQADALTFVMTLSAQIKDAIVAKFQAADSLNIAIYGLATGALLMVLLSGA